MNAQTLIELQRELIAMREKLLDILSDIRTDSWIWQRIYSVMTQRIVEIGRQLRDEEAKMAAEMDKDEERHRLEMHSS